MEKKSIFKTIDELYTKATKKIIGDMPLDEDKPSSKKSTTRNPKQTIDTTGKTSSIKSTFGLFKEKLLNIGKSQDEKTLLYKEVVKKEKLEAKELIKSKKETQKTVNVNKKEAQTSAKKKSTVKKAAAKKTTTKKPETAPTKSKKTTAKKTVTKKTVTKSTSSKETAKKPVTKKTTVNPAENKSSKTTTKSAVNSKSTTAKAPIKKTVSKKTTTSKTSTKKSTSDKQVTSKKPTDKKTSTKKSAAPRGSKKAEKIALYIKDITKHYGEVDEDFVAIIVKNLGPSIYKADAELVSCSDPKELDTVRKSFLVKKLGIDASQGVLDAAIQDVCTELKGVRRKYRATFYYALAKKFKKESVLS